MAIFLLLLFTFIVFIVYRYKKYQKQREIEDTAANAQAYVSAEVVELLQRYKTLLAQQAIPTEEAQILQQHIYNLTENLLCHTDSEASVREYLSTAKQEIALLSIKMDKLSENVLYKTDQFDALK